MLTRVLRQYVRWLGAELLWWVLDWYRNHLDSGWVSSSGIVRRDGLQHGIRPLRKFIRQVVKSQLT